ncbi:TonB-dependent receptor plug domain-containing protein [Niabella ginsengisoli]|uniref:TonB-dependent receptor plug domain-containing protein n=1 Tax=Niabella ginsengisoli TaxID=522298 RepID=A0ABS9SIT9_9BACT|nr:TonB-dependent receptor plug domain-containing protein [Niabella ginsengisoli]MCH5598277.1 TonB-dependent receptor plug domain-containing protein [Niabella ginsengisoli]
MKGTIKIFIAAICMLTVFKTSNIQAQTVTASGKVVSADDLKPVVGATISAWKGRSIKALITTDQLGNFNVKLNPGEEIEVSYTGFITIHHPASDTMLITLERAANDMSQVVVVGYQRKNKETITGAITRITAEDIKDIPSSNLEELMQGRVPGLNVQMNTGAPGFRGAATIRGLSSIGATGAGSDAYVNSNSPLYIVDGVPIDADAGFEYGFQSIGPGTSPLSLIPVEDIETVDVMLDAQATSLYGSRGANGVIVITTKKGKSKIPIITYIGNYFINTVPPLRNTIGGKDERLLRVNTVYENGDYDYIYEINNRPFISDSLNPFYNNSTDWQGIYYTPTYNHSHNVSIAGGDQVLNYKSNLNFYSDRGVIRNTGFDRYAATMSLGFNPNEKLRVNAQVFAAVGKKLKGSGNGLTEVGAGSNIASSLIPGPSFFLDVSQFSGAIYSENDAKTHNFRSFIDISYEIIKNIRLSTNTSYDYTQDSEDFFKPAAADANRTRLYGFSARRSDLYNRSQINYSETYNEKHNFYASVFSELRVNNSTGYVIENRNGPNDYYWGPFGYNSWYSNYAGVQYNSGSATNEYNTIHTIALAANVQYNFNKKYILDLAFRQDGSSYAGENNRWARNPSFGLRWNVEKEKFMENVKWVTSAAMRFTYGINLRPTSNIYASQGQFGVRGTYNSNTCRTDIRIFT